MTQDQSVTTEENTGAAAVTPSSDATTAAAEPSAGAGVVDKTQSSAQTKKPTTLFDGIDDDDVAASDDKVAADDVAATDDKPKEEAKTEEADPNAWRNELLEKIAGPLADKLTAAKLEKRKESILKDLARYKSPLDYMLAGFAAREKIRSGEYKSKLADDASDAEKAAWRKENGLPDSPKDYDVEKVDGYKWTDDDKPFLDSFKEIAFKNNMTQEQMNGAAKWYVDAIAEQQDAYLETIYNTDASDNEIVVDTLKAELGPQEFKPAVRLMERILRDDQIMPDGLGQFIQGARYQDEEGKSRRLINHPGFARFLLQSAKDNYGDASLISGDARAAMNNRKAEIEKVMKTDINRYRKEGMDKEYSEILNKEHAANSRGRRTA